MSVYDLKTPSFPQLTGSGLKLSASVMDTPFFQGLLSSRVLRDAGVSGFRTLKFYEAPCYTPIQDFGVKENGNDRDDPGAVLSKIEAAPGKRSTLPHAGVRDYA